MSFPSSPIDGQQSVINNIKYSYSTATFAWTRVTTSTVSVDGTANVFAITNTSTATTTATGALRVAGGVGVGGDLFVGGNVYSNGSRVYPTNIQNFSAAANTTTFIVSNGYTVGYVQVFANGLLLPPSDYTASDGVKVILTQPRNLNDPITIISSANAVPTVSASPNSLAIAMSVALGI